jgi:hypothetical protein
LRFSKILPIRIPPFLLAKEPGLEWSRSINLRRGKPGHSRKCHALAPRLTAGSRPIDSNAGLSAAFLRFFSSIPAQVR